MHPQAALCFLCPFGPSPLGLVPGRSMPEMTHSGKHEHQAVFVGRIDDFLIADGAPGFDDGLDSGPGSSVDAVPEGKEGVGGHVHALEGASGLFHSQFGGIHAAHLSGAHSHGCVFCGVHDGVGFHPFHDLPGEQEALYVNVRGLRLAYHLEILRFHGSEIAILDDGASHHGSEHAAGRFGCEGTGFEESDILFLCEDFEGLRFERGGDHAFEERGMDLLCGFRGAGAVQSHDAPEKGDRVAFACHAVCLDLGIGHCQAARIGVLEEHNGRVIEFANAIQGRIDIGDIIEREGFSVEEAGPGNGGFRGTGLDVPCCLLVGIFAVTEVADLVPGKGEPVGECGRVLFLREEVTSDAGVVCGCVFEHLSGEFLPGLEREARSGFLHFRDHVIVLIRGADNGHVGEIFGRGPEHRGSPYIDILDHLFEGGIGNGRDLFKGVEVDHDEVDEGEVLLFEGFEVVRVVSPGEDAGEYGGMEGFDAAIHDFGKPGDVRHGFHIEAGLLNGLHGAPGGDNLDPEGCEFFGESGQAGFVRNTDHRALDLGRHQKYPRFSGCSIKEKSKKLFRIKPGRGAIVNRENEHNDLFGEEFESFFLTLMIFITLSMIY